MAGYAPLYTCCRFPNSPPPLTPNVFRASVRHTSASTAIPPTCSGHIDRGVSDRSGLREGADRITFGLGEVIEKLPHFADAHRAWMALAVESDEAFTPIGHGRGRRLGVPLMACGVAQLVKQAWWLYYSRRRLEKSAGAHGCPQGRTYQWAIRTSVHYAWAIRQMKKQKSGTAG
jgi:hypothetical protein